MEAVNSYREAAPLLRQPFTAQAVRWKVQAAFPKGNPTKALIVAYIDARLVAERLNMVCPHLWHDEYEQRGDLMLCALTIDGITRRDVGSDYKGKGLYSDAFKRAAVKFGVGVSLYAVPAITLGIEDGLRKDGSSLALTVKSVGKCRGLYAQWLTETGQKTFGEPLDHGDTDESVGDVEAGPIAEDDQGAGIGKDIATKLVTRARQTEAWDQFQLAASHAAKVDVGDCSTEKLAIKAIENLTFDQAQSLGRWVDKKEAGDE